MHPRGSVTFAPVTEVAMIGSDATAHQPMLKGLAGWQREAEKIVKEYKFKDHYQAQAFTNAVMWVSHREDHHPYLVVGYNTVKVEYWTHAIGGLSENDFICAAKLDQLFDL